MNPQKTETILIILALTFTLFVGILAIMNKDIRVYGQNWLQGWAYRKTHVIEQTPDTSSNYQMYFLGYYINGSDNDYNMYFNETCNANFTDIRFTDNDGETLLDYYMFNVTDGVSATFWVKISDDLGDDDVYIYVYYGNPNAVTSLSDLDDTFIFGEDWENQGGILDSSRWSATTSIHNYTIGNYSYAGQYLPSVHIGNMSLNSRTNGGIHSQYISNFPSTNWILQSLYEYPSGFVNVYEAEYDNMNYEVMPIISDSSYWGDSPNLGLYCGIMHREKNGSPSLEGFCGINGNIDHTESPIPDEGYEYCSWTIYNLDGIGYINRTYGIGTTYKWGCTESCTDTPHFVHLGMAQYYSYNKTQAMFCSFIIRQYVDPEPQHGLWGIWVIPPEEEEPDVYIPPVVDITDVPSALALIFNIPEFVGGLLASAFVILALLLPAILISERQGSVVPIILMGILAISICVGLTWLSIWFLVIIVFLIALLFAKQFGKMIT